MPHPRKKAHGGGSNINCPMCVSRGESRPDTKFRCGIRTFPTGALAINCFNCSFATRWSPGSLLSRNLREFLSNIGVNDLEIKKLNFTAWQMKQNDIAVPERESPMFIPNFQEIELPPMAMPISQWAEMDCEDPDFLDVVMYAMSRGDELFSSTEFYWSPDTQHGMNRRLLIPFYWRGKIVGWTGRSVDEKVQPRYYTNTPPHFLFNNENMNKDRKFIILVEGQFDALAIDGVSTQGAKLSEQQAYWLNDSGKHIIVLPDRDEAGQKLIDLALQYGWSVSFPCWDPHVKDANDAVKAYGKLFAVRSIIDGATDNKLKINLLRKKLVQ